MTGNTSIDNIEINNVPFKTSVLLELYTTTLKSRLIEEKMLVLLRQGKISKWFSGIGQEAISVGVTMALNTTDYVLPMHRNLGVFVTRKIPLYRLFSQWQGKAAGFTKGRDRSFHFGSQQHRIIGMISHLGPQLGVADGIALAAKLKDNKQVTTVFTGEGGTSEGDFHEALNVASVWQLPVLFCVENNGYGLSTPTNQQYNCKHIADRGMAYGMESHIIDGNNVFEVYSKVKHIVQSIRLKPRPVLIEFKTFRIRGHEESSGVDYVPKHLIEKWSKKDPLNHLELVLKSHGVLSDLLILDINNKIKDEITTHLKTAYNELEVISSIGAEVQFGAGRVRNTPICESAIVETAMGLSIAGMKAVVEMQFADFASSGFNPIVNYLAKSFYRWNENADVVIRMPCGAGVGAGPFHSQTNEAWFTKTPGLKVVYPAFPVDAKGLLIASINDPNPVLFFEHKGLYRTINQSVPINYYNIPLGKAALIQTGQQVTVISYGAAVHWALEVLDKNKTIQADVIDLRTLCPLDMETIYNSVKKTGRAIILQEDSLFGGIASDIAANIMENCFNFLDAPVKRVASLNTPIPFAKQLEDQYLPKNRFEKELITLLKY